MKMPIHMEKESRMLTLSGGKTMDQLSAEASGDLSVSSCTEA